MPDGVKILSVEGVIVTADGVRREFSIGPDGGWQQWGATTEDLGNTVYALEAMSNALLEDSMIETSDDEDED